MYEIDPITKAAVASRAEVYHLLLHDLSAALAEARANPHPWYRCQSLTAVAAAIEDDEQAAGVLHEALASAKQQDEPNRVVSVAAWPVSIGVARSLLDMPAVITELLEILGREPNPIRRADALLLLLEAVMDDAMQRRIVLTSLLEACAQRRSRKSRWILHLTALVVGNHQGLAQEVLSHIPESRELRRTKALLARRHDIGPHKFIPYYSKR